MKKPKLVCGVGINDADYCLTPTVNGIRVQCKFYGTWRMMLQRGYSKKFKERYPTYSDCSVCIEWHTFSNFKAWMETQEWEGKELDKDLIVPGNKVYGPDFCIFVSRGVNCFLLERQLHRGILPIGVILHRGHFVAQCSNPFKKKRDYLGIFENPDDAHKAWLARKLELAFSLAEIQTDARIAKLLIERYSEYGSEKSL